MGKFRQQILDYPQKNYALKAMQDIVEVTQKNEFTVNDVLEELKTLYPNMTKKSLGIILSQYFVSNGLIENVRKRGRGEPAIRALTTIGLNADWRTWHAKEKRVQDYKAETKKIKLETEPLQKKLTDQQERFDWVEAFLEYIDHLKRTVDNFKAVLKEQKGNANALLEASLRDQKRRHNNEIKEWRDVLKAKDKTIEELNGKISSLNALVRKQTSGNILQDVARFRESRKY